MHIGWVDSPPGISNFLYLFPAAPPSQLIRMDDTASPSQSIPMAIPSLSLHHRFRSLCYLSADASSFKHRGEGCDGLIARQDIRTDGKGRASIHTGIFIRPRSILLTAPDLSVNTAADATDNGAKLNGLLRCHVSRVRTNLSCAIAKGHHLKFNWLNAR